VAKLGHPTAQEPEDQMPLAPRFAKYFLFCSCLSTIRGQIIESSNLDGPAVTIQFGVQQLDATKEAAVAQKAYGFIYDAELRRQIPVSLKLKYQGNQIRVELFTSAGPIDPVRGLESLGLMPVNPKSERKVVIYLEGVFLMAIAKPLSPQFVSVDAGLSPPELSGLTEQRKGSPIFDFEVLRLTPKLFEAAVAKNLKRLELQYDFSPDDYQPLIKVSPVRFFAIPGSQTGFSLEAPFSLPKRPESYTVKLTVPADIFPELAGVKKDLSVRMSVDKTTFPAIDEEARKKAAFYLDATFRSFVDPSVNNGQRRNSGLFSYAWRPVVAGRTFHNGRTVTAWRALSAASVSTDPLRELVKSGAPTQIQHGIDLELIRNHFSIAASLPTLAQSIFSVGVRHESDRDFKFQTAFARLAYSPIFKGWTQSREYRVATMGNKSPIVSMWSLVPTASYDIGSVTRDRLQRLVPFPLIADQLYRANFDLTLEIEISRAIRLTAKDTYSYLWAFPRRPHRNFFSGSIDFNSGYLFGRSALGGIQNALVLKFERGEQTPTYKPVNTFSIGFKLFN